MKLNNSTHSKRFARQTLSFLFLAVALGSFQNCAKTSFSKSELEGVDGTNRHTCTDELTKTKIPVKILFVVDTSDSNNYTDPGQAMRQGSIQAFYDSYHNKNNFSWSFISFAGSNAIALINNGSSSSPKFSNASDMQSAIASFSGIKDTGNTPYKAAINMAKNAILNDSGSSMTKYAIVFLSDGQPTDYGNPTSDDKIMEDIESLVSLKSGEVTFSAVYYGPNSVNNSTRLKNMATAGHGRFLDTNTEGKNFAISDLVTLSNSTCSAD